MPFNCDVCGNEVSYEEPIFVLRNNAEIVICKRCLLNNKAIKGKLKQKIKELKDEK